MSSKFFLLPLVGLLIQTNFLACGVDRSSPNTKQELRLDLPTLHPDETFVDFADVDVKESLTPNNNFPVLRSNTQTYFSKERWSGSSPKGGESCTIRKGSKLQLQKMYTTFENGLIKVRLWKKVNHCPFQEGFLKYDDFKKNNAVDLIIAWIERNNAQKKKQQQNSSLTEMQVETYIWPTKGVISSNFGWRWGRRHKGIDVAAPTGTPIVAAKSGKVIATTPTSKSGGFGNLVKVEHLDGDVTYYAHASQFKVKNGDTVKQGQVIALVGSTGRSTGPHLHFEIRKSGKTAVDPKTLLAGKPEATIASIAGLSLQEVEVEGVTVQVVPGTQMDEQMQAFLAEYQKKASQSSFMHSNKLGESTSSIASDNQFEMNFDGEGHPGIE